MKQAIEMVLCNPSKLFCLKKVRIENEALAQMKNHRGIIFTVALAAFSAAALATDKPKAPVALDGPTIIRIFDGKAVTGVYADKTPVRESYKIGGGMDYWDPYRTTTGTWSVVNNQLCTFYNDAEMSGGCFRVEQVSANCFDYYAVAGSTSEALTPSDKPRYTARASIDGVPETCPDELSV
jgi:hypothetical protein